MPRAAPGAELKAAAAASRRLSVGFIQPDAAATAALGLDLQEASLGFRTTAADILHQQPTASPSATVTTSSGGAAAGAAAGPGAAAVSDGDDVAAAPEAEPAAKKRARAPSLGKGCRVRFRVALDDSKESAHAGRRLRAICVLPCAATGSSYCVRAHALAPPITMRLPSM